MAALSTLKDVFPVVVSDTKPSAKTSTVPGRKRRLWKFSVIVFAGMLLFSWVDAVTTAVLPSGSSSNSNVERQYKSASAVGDSQVVNHRRVKRFAVVDACNQPTYCTEGDLMADADDCNMYYECKNGKWNHHSCGQDCYDVDLGECVDCGISTCQEPCPPVTGTTMPPPEAAWLSDSDTSPQWTTGPQGSTERPVTHTTELVTTARPVTSTTDRDETTDRPVTYTTEREATTDRPVTYTTQREATTDRHATTTAGPLPDDREPPAYSTILLGNFTSSPDGDFDFDCTNRYSDALHYRALEMIPIVNDKLGSELCNQHALGDFSMMSVSTILTTSGPEGETDLNFKTVLDRNLRIDDVYGCMAEVSTYLRDHVNWGPPLLPQLPGCPFPLFDPEVFYSGGDKWFCISNSKGMYDNTYTETTPALPYEIDIASNFTTSDDTDLSSQCASDYSNDLMEKVALMQSALNKELLGSRLCSGISIEVITSTSVVVYQDSEGIASVQFIMQIADHHRFTDLFSCADEVMEYLFDHANWEIPLLHQIPDCPFLEFHEQRFYAKGQRWLCLSF